MMADQNDLTFSYDAGADLLQVHETFTGDLVAEQLRAETSAVVITGTEGDDRLVMDLAGSYIFPGGMMFDGAGGSDELVGSEFNDTWIIDGIDSGALGGLDFESVERLTGAANNEDVFHLLAGGQSTGGLEGGDGGFDTVAVDAAGLDLVSVPTGPASGTLDIGGFVTAYDGFEPVPVTNAPNITLNLGNAGTSVTLTYDAGASTATTDVFNIDSAAMETHVLSIDSSVLSVTINLEGGADTIDISGVSGTQLDGKLTVTGGGAADTFNLGAGHGDLTITGGDDADVININVTGPLSTIVLGDVITTASVGSGLDVVTVTDIAGFSAINSNASVTNITNFLNAVNGAFDDVKALLADVQAGAQFAATLPLVGGTTLIEQADVSISKAIDFVEALDNARAQVVDKIEGLIASGTTALSDIEDAIEGIAATVKGLGPALASQKVALESEISAALASFDSFGITLSAQLEGVAGTKTLDVALNFAQINAVGGNKLNAIVQLVNEAIVASDDFGSNVQAVASNGRLALQVLSGEVTSFSVKALNGMVNNMADTVFGHTNSFATLASAEISERLSGLGDMLLQFRDVNVGINADGEFEFDFQLVADRTTAFSFDFGAEADQLGLSIDGGGRLNLVTGFLIGIELDLDPLGGSFDGVLTDFGAGIAITEGAVNVDAAVGLISGKATGSVMLDAGLFAAANVVFSDGSASFGFAPSVTGFDAAVLASGTGNAFAGAASYDVALEFEVGANLIEDGFGGSFKTTVTISGADPFNGTVPDIDVDADFDQLFDFNSFSPADIVGIIADFVLWLDDATGSDLLADIEIPFVGGGIDQIANIGAMLSNQFLYDVGADGQKDGDDRLVTDLNDAFQAAGLDAYIRAEGDGGSFKVVIIDDRVEEISIVGSEAGLGQFGWNLLTTTMDELSVAGGVFLNGVLSRIAGTMRVSFKADTGLADVDRDFEVTAEAMAKNTGIGDDKARLIDRFNAPTFGSAQEFLVRLVETGLLESLGFDANDLSQYYDAAEDRLTLDLSIDANLFDVELPADFSLDLGTLLDVTSDTRLVLSGTGAINLVLGFDFTADPSAPGDLPGPGGDISGTTLLSDLGVRPKVEPAITGTATPTAMGDLTFTVEIDEGTPQTAVVTLSGVDMTAGTATQIEMINTLVTDINTQLSGINVTVSAVTDPLLENFGKLSFDRAVGTSAYAITVTSGDTTDMDDAGDSTDLSIAFLGINGTQTATDQSLVAERQIKPLVGVFDTDAVVALALTGTGGTSNFTFRVAASDAASIVDGDLRSVNRSIIDVVADVKAAMSEAIDLGSADPDATTDLNEYFDVGFQGSRLVLTLRAVDSIGDMVPFDGFSVVGDVDVLGLSGGQTGNLNDFEVVLDNGTVLTVDLSAQGPVETLTIDDVIAAMAAADANLVASITVDDPTTAVDEGAKGLTVTYDTAAAKLVRINAVNGSSAGIDLGILGADVPKDSTETPDGKIIGLNIGGLSLADRFFIAAADGSSLSDIAEFEFSASAARLLDDVRIFGPGNVIFSGSVDLRNYIGKDITFRGVNGVAEATYTIGTVVAIDVNGTEAGGETEGVTLIPTGGAAVNHGAAGQTDIRAIVDAGVNASASLGFVGVELTGSADFGAKISVGLNTNAGPASDEIVTLGEVLEAFDEESGLGVLDFFQLPEVGFRDGTTSYGSVDLKLGLAEGSLGFQDLAAAFLPGTADTIDFSIDLLALGDPLLKTRFEPNGVIATTTDSFTVVGDFTDILVDGQILRFTIAGADAAAPDRVFEAKIDALSVASGNTTVTVGELTAVSGIADVNAINLTTAAFGNLTLRPTAIVDFPELGALFDEGFGQFGIDEIITALQLLADFLGQFEAFDFMDQTIPVIDKSLGHLLGLADDLVDFIEELRANPSESLQFIEDAINDAIGISSATLAQVYESVNGTPPPADMKAFEIGYDEGQQMLTFTLNLGVGFSEALNVGLSDIGFGPDLFAELGLDGIVSFTGSAGLEAGGGILMTLALGIDLDEFVEAPADIEDAIYILDDTNLEAVVGASGTNLAFSAGLGPLALAIQNIGSDVAEVNISAGAELSSTFTGRLSIGDLFGDIGSAFEIGGANGATSYGSVDGLLPVFFPNDSNYIGAIKLGETALAGRGDLLNFGNLAFSTQTPVDGIAGLGEQQIDPNALLIDVSELVDFFENFSFSDFSIFDTISLAVDGFDSFLSILEVNIFGALSELQLPLVGSSFADASNFIGDFRTDFVGALRTAIDLIEDAAQDFTDAEKNVISNLLYDLLGPEGLNLLLRLDGQAITGAETVADFIGLSSDPLAGVLFDGDPLDQADIGWNFVIGQNLLPADLENVNLDFDLGIPGLGLRSEAEIDMMLDWTLEIGFGLSTKEGFYLEVGNDDPGRKGELEFNASVIPSGAITGELGFLGLTAETETEDGGFRDINGEMKQTGLFATFYMDVFDDIDGGADDNIDRLSLTEFTEIGLTFGVDVEAAAVLDLTLGLSQNVVGDSVASGFPSITADFDFLWVLDDLAFDVLGDNGNNAGDSIGKQLADGLQYLAFNDVNLDVGEFLTEVLGPIVDAVAEYTEPLQPFIDFLTAPIPLVDIFGIELTMLDLAAQLGKFDAGLIEGIAEVITLVNTIAELREDGGVGSIEILIGDFVIFDGAGMTDNPFQEGICSSSIANSRDLSALAGDFDAALASVIDDSGRSDKDRNASKTVQKLKKPGGSFAFPILQDPGQIFGLLMGEPATLVTFDLEPLIVGFEKSFFFSIFGPLGVSLGLEVEFEADFAFGFDTLGISQFVETDFSNPLLLFNGLYISDTENPDGTGADVPELTFLGGITAAAELNLGIARAGVAGGLFIEILFDLFDPDNDGKVRITELVNNFVNQTRAPTDGEKLLAPLAVFDVTGEIFARLFAFLKIDFGFFEIDKEFDLVDPITILEFEIDFFRPPVVASEVGNGDLIINIGEFAEQRLLGNATDFGETVNIRKVSESPTGDIVVEVWTNANGFGPDSPIDGNRFKYDMKAGQKMIVKAGNGNDTIIFHNWDGDEVLFDVEGGAGNDTIEFRDSTAANGTNASFNTLDGGAGDDTIIGSSGRDYIVGGAGNDSLTGGFGADLVIGDQVDVFSKVISVNPVGNDGADYVAGGEGDDIVIGGGGRDTVLGGGGDDLLIADGGEVAFIGTGQKILSNVLALHRGGVTGTDSPGAGAADIITGGSGNDVIFAGGGNDDIDAGEGSDVVFGGAGFDDIVGGAGSDLIFGDVGIILQSLLDAAAGDMKTNMSALNNSSDLVQLSKRLAVGPDGSGDTIWGDARDLGNTDIAAGSNDLIFGAGGNDEIHAGGGDDLVWAGAGADKVYGDFGADDLRGESQGDFIDGGSDNDVLNGGTGPDIVFGRGGDDFIIATKGSDDLNGGIGNDTYIVNFSGGTAQSLISIVDGSTDDTDVDVLEINGTDRADRFLVRSDTSGNNAFIASLNGNFNAERVNYGKTLERIIVNGGAGDDIFAVDDTAAEMTLNGEAGNDQFQIGQLFRTERNVNAEEGGIDTGINAEDFFLTIEVTRGWLSNGISFPMVVNGGIGNDNFVVYHNKAALQLNGESGDDIFEVRAFALAGSQEPQRERTDLTGGSGADTVRYAVNAPVNINGGDGYDTLIVIGTEFGDDFVITDNGVFGAGLNVNFVNIESLRVDGAEGDDRFFVQSTLNTVLTELFGGLGNDTFNASGPTPPVVSNDFRGHSGLITHDVTSSDIRYDGQALYGISANVADNDIPFAIITQTQGSTIVDEGDTVGDSYQVVLTRAPVPGRSVFVTVGAPLPSPDQREQGIYFFRVASVGAVNTLANGSAVVLEFTSANYNIAQTVQVIADGVADDAPSRLFTRGDLDPAGGFLFDYDDTAFEGQRNGVITHKFAAGENQAITNANFLSTTTNGDGEVRSMTLNTTLSADDVLGRVVTITEGGGFGDFRFITGAVDNGASLTVSFAKAWDVDNNPDPSTSTFFIRLDDAIIGLVDTVSEDKAAQIFDDRSTLTAIEADGVTSLNFGPADSLIGATVEIIGGTGAGQQLLILSNTTTELTLNGIWNIDPVGDSVFRIAQYDGLNSQVVEVLVNDNDTPGLIVDQTVALDGAGNVVAGDDTITAVIEGSNADQMGEADALNLRLTTDLVGGQTVTVALDYDTSEIKLVATADPDGVALTSLTFTSADNAGINLFVYAVDDAEREGAHTAQITFGFTPNFGDPNETPVADSVQVDISNTEPVSSLGTTFPPSAITSVIDDNVTLEQGVDYVLIPDSNKILFVTDGDVNDPAERSGIITINYTYSEPTYYTASAQSVLVRISDDDAPTVLVRESGGSTDVIEGGLTDSYELVLTGELTGTDTVVVDLTEIITKTTQTGGIRHDLGQVQIMQIIQDGVVLYYAANADPSVADPNVTIVTDASGNPIADSGGIAITQVSVTFDASNWDKAITVVVAAVDDAVVDGGDTKVFAPGPETLAQILGPVVVDGAGGSGSLFGLGAPLMLPGELNIKPETGDIMTIVNNESGALVTVDRADITAEVIEDLRIYIDGTIPRPAGPVTNEELLALIGKTMEFTRAPAAPSLVDQFKLIVDVTYTATTVTFVLNEGFDLATDELGNVIESFDPLEAVSNPDNAGFPAPVDTPESSGDDLVNRYAITSESLNFFVDERASVDVLFVHDGDSPADSSGTLTSNRLFGLNMGPDTVIGDRARQGGITFGELEVVDITLGAGYNTLDIIGAPTNSLGGQTWTIIRTGDEVPYAPLGDPGDIVTVQLNAEDVVVESGTGFAGVNPLSTNGFNTVVALDGAILGDDLNGQLLRLYDATGDILATRWIVGQEASAVYVDLPLEILDGTGLAWEIVDPADGSLAVDLQGGNDLLDATGSTKGMVVFGGAGDDTITTGSGDDIVFGDVGRVDYRNADGAIVTRLGSTPDVILGSAIAPFSDASLLATNQNIFPVADLSTGRQGDPFETGLTGLAGLFADVNNGSGALQEPRLIWTNTASDLGVTPAFTQLLDATSDFRISTLPEDQTDGVFWGPSLIVAIADAMGGNDVIDTGAGDDVAMGGEGADDITLGTADATTDNDIGFGDLGMVRATFLTGAVVAPVAGESVPTLRDGVFAVEIGIGGDDTIRGNAGDDLIVGGAGADEVYGDDENATAGVNDGDDTIIGDAGFVDYADGIVSRVETYRAVGAAYTISGNAGADMILGGLGGDVIWGDAANAASDIDGNDLIFGDHGAAIYDVAFDGLAAIYSTLASLVGVAETFGGADVIRGNAGADIVLGGTGADILDGDDQAGSAGENDGNDILVGDTGLITFASATGTSLLSRIETTDVVDGTGDNDTIRGRAGSDRILGGVGSDMLYGDAPDDDLDDGDASIDGDDLIIGDNGVLAYGLEGTPDYTTLDLMISKEDGLGAADTIAGNAANDLIIGGYGGDSIDGNGASNRDAGTDGNDVIIGDNGVMNFEGGVPTSIRTADKTAVFAADDTINGASGADILLGGLGSDMINGDHQAGNTSTHDAGDIILGDNGELIWDEAEAFTAGTAINEQGFVPTRDLGTLDVIRTTEVAQGGADTITASLGDDMIMGGFGGDRINAGANDDIVLGDFGRIELLMNVARYITITDDNEGGADTIFGDEDEDVLIGGAGADRIDGDGQRDMIFGDNVTLDRLSGFGDLTDPRFRVLTDGQIYGDGIGTGAEGEVLVGAAANRDPSGAPAWQDWDIVWLDHDQQTDLAGLNNFGDDYIAGGGDQDVIFGQLGNDTIQGDGSIDSLDQSGIAVDALRLPDGSLSVSASFEALTDDDDYIEGNGGDDVIFGNLGQDDIIGDNSDLYSLDTLDARTPAGSDMIFGGAGIRIDRNEYIEDRNGDGVVDTTDIALADRHSRDSDMIMGDNGRIFRLVAPVAGLDTAALSFVYDALDDNATEHYAAQSRGDERIEVRAADLLDYTRGGLDVDPAGTVNDRGAADEIHGESGDDFVYGLVGNDVIFGGSDDDDIIGGYGADWISGGTGQDGVIGGDGRIWTSKNTSEAGDNEVLYGIGTVDVDIVISTPGNRQQAAINIDNALKKTVDLTPFYADGSTDQTKVADASLYDNDIIFGGLGSDFLHGGFGSDAISGAEAMSGDVSFELNGTTYTYTLLPFSYDNPGNPGDYLAYGQADGRPTEFAAYDENNPRPMVFVAHETVGDPTSPLIYVDPALRPDATPFLLNFDANDGAGTDTTAQADGLPSDGNDIIFGDLGHDWLVGGTGNDRIYGGFGDDILDADDDRTTDSGANQSPDTADSYADIAVGGAGRDILIANTGADRLIDWVGEFNSYIVPFAPFGAPTISRSVQPQIFEFLYDLSEADGADPTRIVDSADDSRNGEPYGEAGLVKQQDPFWQDQTGGPDDPQPGNIGGGSRDVTEAGDVNLANTGNVGGGNTGNSGNGNSGNGNSGNSGNGNGGVGNGKGKGNAATASPLTTSASDLGGDSLDASSLQYLMDAAIKLMAAEQNLSAAEVAYLSGINVQIADLDGETLALAQGNTITFDRDGAGHGYFIDQTPEDNVEFDKNGVAIAGSAADGAIDLLTVALHELGHILGADHVTGPDAGYMSGILDPSQRLGLTSMQRDTAHHDAAGNTNAKPAATLVYDDRVGAMITLDEAMLLDAVDGATVIAPANGKNKSGKPKSVKWAAE